MTLPYGHQWIDKDDIRSVVRALKSSWLTQGPKVQEFERVVANYCGAKYAVALCSGTAALHAAYAAAGIKKGDEVITSPLTFVATANAVIYCGGRPVFADIKEDTLNIDPKEIRKKITKKTKVIAPIDFAGHPCDLDEIRKIGRKHNLLIIEDAAHALGSEYKGRKIGSMSDMTVFSFHPVKVITTGEGGMVVTNNKRFYEKLKAFRHHGIVKKEKKGGWYYEIGTPGYNLRITDFQCALGLSQLKKIKRFIKKRRQIVAQYNKAFKGIEEIIIPREKSYTKSAWHIYPVQFRLEKLKITRKKIFEYFQKKGIGVQVHYMPIHLHPFYKKLGYKKGDFPKSEKYYERTITLPLFPGLTKQQTHKVIKTVKNIVNSYRIN